MLSALRMHVGNLLWVSKMTLPLTKQVELAQAGDEEATLALLEAFGWREKGRWYNFLGKYDKLLWHGRLDMKNKKAVGSSSYSLKTRRSEGCYSGVDRTTT